MGEIELVEDDTKLASITLRMEQRTSRATQRVVTVLDTHPELRGVHAPADLIDDAVRWCA